MFQSQPPISLLPLLRRGILALVLAYLFLPTFAAHAQVGGIISGRVTNDAGEPLESVSVTLQNDSWSWSKVTDDAGEYTIEVSEPGIYQLLFWPQLGPYRPEYYSNKSSAETADEIVIAAGDELADYDAVLPNAGRVVGTVVDTTGEGIAGIRVDAHFDNDFYYDIHATAYSDSNGNFSLPLPRDGEYQIGFTDPTGQYLDEYYNDKLTLESADDVRVAAEEVLTVTVELRRHPTISGTVMDEQGEPVADAAVSLYVHGFGDWMWQTQVNTDAYGNYQFQELESRLYRLEFTDNEIIQEYYNNKNTFADADILDLTTGPEHVIANAVVTRRGIVEGTVTDMSGRPVEDLSVILYRNTTFGGWSESVIGTTDRDGKYHVSAALPDAEYRIRFFSTGLSVDEYYDDVSTIETAQGFTVPFGTKVQANAQVTGTAVVTGSVVNTSGEGIAGVDVSVMRNFGGVNTYAETKTNEDGVFSLHIAANQNNALYFNDPSGQYLSEYYDSVSSLDHATPIAVTEEGIITVTAELLHYPTISGTVTNSQGEPLESIAVMLLRYDEFSGGWNEYTWVSTDANGGYTLSTFEPGTYRIQYDPGIPSQYRAAYYPNGSTIEEADDIVLAIDDVLTGYDVVLPAFGRIVGTVVNLDGEGVEGISIEALYDNGLFHEVYATAQSNSTGDFSLTLPYDYNTQLYFRDPEGRYRSEYYNDKLTIESADEITVAVEQVITISVELRREATISGTVVDSSGKPVSNVLVELYEDDNGDWDWRDLVTTDARGRYRFPEITHQWTNRYRLYFLGENIVDEYYNDQDSFETADILDLNSGPELAIANAEVRRSSVITGIVTDVVGKPVQGVYVSFYYWAENTWTLEHSTYTGVDGEYFAYVDAVSPEYRVQFDGREVDHSNKYYDNAATLETAQTLVIPAESTVTNINGMLRHRNQVEANFSGGPISGTGSISVTLNNLSTGPVATRAWNFGDGTTSSALNPSHTYTTPGVYTVTLTVDGPENSHSITKTNYITLTDTPITEVEIEQETPGGSEQPVIGETIYFSASAGGSNVQYLWDFGDEVGVAATASGQYVQHSYDAAGDYTVTLTARNGADEEVTTMVVSVQEEPVSALALHGPVTATVGTSVSFSATVGTGQNVSYAWAFGDGATASGEVVSHTYAITGTFTVSVTAGNATNEQAATQQITIEEAVSGEEPVNEPEIHAPSAAFVNGSIVFSGTASGDNVLYTWDFGDGETATGEMVSHRYAAPGSYTVTLTASNSQGKEEITITVIVRHGMLLPILRS